MLTVPESIIRAVAAAPDCIVKHKLLAAMGLNSDLETVSQEEQEQGISYLAEISGQYEEAEIPYLPGDN